MICCNILRGDRGNGGGGCINKSMLNRARLIHRNSWINTLGLGQNGCVVDDISNEFSWMKCLYIDLTFTAWAVWYKTKFGSQNFGYQIWFCNRRLSVQLTMAMRHQFLVTILIKARIKGLTICRRQIPIHFLKLKLLHWCKYYPFLFMRAQLTISQHFG